MTTVFDYGIRRTERRGPRAVRATAVAAACALALGLSGCGNDGAREATREGADAVSADGEQLYQANCASCHGADLRGTDKGPSHLSQVYEPSHHPDEAFVGAAKNGVNAHHWDFGDMAPVPGLDDEDLAELIAYVRAVQQREGFEPYPP